MTREELIEAIVESKYRETLTRLAKRFNTDASDFDQSGGASMQGYFPGKGHLPVVKKIRSAARDNLFSYEAGGPSAWSGTLKDRKKGEGLHHALIKVHSRKAKLDRQGYGPEMDRWRVLKNLPMPKTVN